MGKNAITGLEMRKEERTPAGGTKPRGESEKRGRGRPPLTIANDTVLQVRMPRVEFEAIRRLAFDARKTMSQCARDLLHKGGLKGLTQKSEKP